MPYEEEPKQTSVIARLQTIYSTLNETSGMLYGLESATKMLPCDECAKASKAPETIDEWLDGIQERANSCYGYAQWLLSEYTGK